MKFRIAWFALCALMVTALVTSIGSAAPRRGKPIDKIWVHPDFVVLGIEKIAVLPVATFDNNYEAQKVVEQAFGQVFRTTGYRWVSTASSRDLLRAHGSSGDSLAKALQAQILKTERVDSLAAPGLCAWLRADAVLSLRVDQWEREQVEWNQTGKPYTQVQLRATLVDSLGRLLWSASGSNKGEGSDHSPDAAVEGVTTSGLGSKPITAQAGAPSFPEVVLPLFTRWVELFPGKSVAADSARGGTR